jgi:hypothetical protein
MILIPIRNSETKKQGYDSSNHNPNFSFFTNAKPTLVLATGTETTLLHPISYKNIGGSCATVISVRGEGNFFPVW